jgi:CBS domain containing-hemolysin-like protein
MDPKLWLALAGITLLLTAWLFVAGLELAKMSGGRLRKLEDINEKLADSLSKQLPVRDDWRFAGRLLLIIGIVAFHFFLDQSSSAHSEQLSAMRLFLKPLLLLAVAYGICELLSQKLSLSWSARLLSHYLPCLRTCAWLLAPITVPMAAAIKYAREKQQGDKENVSLPTAEDEILSLVEAARNSDDGGETIQEDERRMILGAFALDQTFVHEIMTPRVDVDGVEENASIADVRRAIVSSGHSRLPLYSGSIDHVLGILYAKDLLDEERLQKVKALRDLAHPPVFIPETKNIGDLLEEFRQSTNHFAIVLDEYGGTAGIVTFEDILEEIVGDIQDEYDDEEELLEIQPQADGSYLVDGRMPICEVNELLDVDISEEEDYDTLGGYLSTFLGRIPKQGEAVTTEILQVQIVEANPRRVVKLKIGPASAEQEENADKPQSGR